MKKLFFFWLLLLAASLPAQIAVQDGAIFCFFSDSYDQDSTASGNKGHRFVDYLGTFFYNNYPSTNIHWRSCSRSGGDIYDCLTNRVEKFGLAHWGYQTNSVQHFGFWNGTDNNGTTSSNEFFTNLVMLGTAVTNLHNGVTGYTNEGGWCALTNAAQNAITWFFTGEIPSDAADGGASGVNHVRSLCSLNAGAATGNTGFDLWSKLIVAWSNDFANGDAIESFFSGSHPGSGRHLDMALCILREMVGSDTNVSLATLDWTAATVSITNNCALTGVSRSANMLTFTRRDDRMPVSWDVPDGTITNDCRPAFALMPELGNLFRQMLTITNLPFGNYTINLDGSNIAMIASAQLSAGWNMSTNYTGAFWAQRQEVLGRVRDLRGVNRVSLAPHSAGSLGVLGVADLVNYDSFAGSFWATNSDRGDVLIGLLNSKESNLYTYDAAIKAAAQQTNHVFTITLQVTTNAVIVGKLSATGNIRM